MGFHSSWNEIIGCHSRLNHLPSARRGRGEGACGLGRAGARAVCARAAPVCRQPKPARPTPPLRPPARPERSWRCALCRAPTLSELLAATALAGVQPLVEAASVEAGVAASTPQSRDAAWRSGASWPGPGAGSGGRVPRLRAPGPGMRCETRREGRGLWAGGRGMGPKEEGEGERGWSGGLCSPVVRLVRVRVRVRARVRVKVRVRFRVREGARPCEVNGEELRGVIAIGRVVLVPDPRALDVGLRPAWP